MPSKSTPVVAYAVPSESAGGSTWCCLSVLNPSGCPWVEDLLGTRLDFQAQSLLGDLRLTTGFRRDAEVDRAATRSQRIQTGAFGATESLRFGRDRHLYDAFLPVAAVGTLTNVRGCYWLIYNQVVNEIVDETRSAEIDRGDGWCGDRRQCCCWNSCFRRERDRWIGYGRNCDGRISDEWSRRNRNCRHDWCEHSQVTTKVIAVVIRQPSASHERGGRTKAPPRNYDCVVGPREVPL